MSVENSQYLESKILTALPHRLHLMLIDGAIRFGRQAEAAMRQGDAQASSAPLLRAIDIAGELLAGVREEKSELNRQLASLYWFLFRRLTEAKIDFNVDKLHEALKLLEYERETWQIVCERMGQVAEGPVPSPHAAMQSHPAAARSATTRVSFQA